jgi:predicted RNA-binding Zn-ribbon protein involved in translation (DUF1610 family)
LAIQQIAKIVNANASLTAQVDQFLKRLSGTDGHFSVLSETGSLQTIMNSVIVADTSMFSAHGGSTNVIQNTEIHSKSTHLHATGGSRNLVDQTFFNNSKSPISMQRVETTGMVSVGSNGVGFGPNGMIGFGKGSSLNFHAPPDPNIVQRPCPSCGKVVKADNRELAKNPAVKCPHCGAVHI